MTNANWMITLANSHRKALAGLGYTAQAINAMDLKEAEQVLKKLGYDFKANSPFKNK